MRAKLKDLLSKPLRTAFFCCFAAGYIAHIFAFTNIIPNADGISRVADAQQMTISGRWFLHYASAWNGYVQAPAVIGFFAILFLSLAAGLTVDLLRVRSPLFAGLIGAVMSVFPSVAYTFLYLFTASAYCFGILLAVLAVWLAVRYRWGFLWAAPVLACAIGTYQAYLAVAASLCLLWLLLRGLEGKRSARELLLEALRLLGFLVLALAIYWVVLRIFLRVKDLTLLDYKGIGGFGAELSLKSLLSQTASAYLCFIKYFFVPRSFANYTTPVAVLANTVLALTALWSFVRLLRRGACLRKPGAFALTLVFCLLLPLALDLTVLMGEAMPIMRYALVFAYVLALALAERAAGTPAQEAGSQGEDAAKPAELSARLPMLLKGAAVCAGCLLLAISFNIINLAYTVSAQAHRATESFATRLVERVESTPGYVNGMEVVVIGGFPSKIYYNEIEAFTLVEDYSDRSDTVIPLNKHIYYYLNDWLNVPWAEPSEEILMGVAASPGFQAMPLYPDDGCIVISGNRVIVKLAPVYTPKRDYEIAYENRR